MTDLLFVYGTLRRQVGEDLIRRLAPHASYLGQARTRGRLYDLGSYPGLVPSESGEDWVQGDLVRLAPSTEGSPAVESALATIDAYEGSAPGDSRPREFERISITAVRASGETIEAWAYRYGGDTRRRPRITSGDYLAWTWLGLGH